MSIPFENLWIKPGLSIFHLRQSWKCTVKSWPTCSTYTRKYNRSVQAGQTINAYAKGSNVSWHVLVDWEDRIDMMDCPVKDILLHQARAIEPGPRRNPRRANRNTTSENPIDIDIA